MVLDRKHQQYLPRVGDEDGDGLAQSAVREEGQEKDDEADFKRWCLHTTRRIGYCIQII
jgi:hypothetical protein